MRHTVLCAKGFASGNGSRAGTALVMSLVVVGDANRSHLCLLLLVLEVHRECDFSRDTDEIFARL